MKRKNNTPDYFLDITRDVCPMTFVKARLQVEKMKEGESLQIRLLGEEPLKNVPDSLTELGHRIVALDRERPDAEIYTLVVEKK
ncbi:MAG: TusA-related sulfurtransferase [Paracoccaceae bacterium]|jgi:TusA-related sulfurtransferase